MNLTPIVLPCRQTTSQSSVLPELGISLISNRLGKTSTTSTTSSAPDRDRLLRRHSGFVRPWAVIHADWQRRRRTSRLTFLRLSPCNLTHPLDRQSANAVADTEPPFRARSCPERRYRHHEIPVPSLRSTRSAMPCPI